MKGREKHILAKERWNIGAPITTNEFDEKQPLLAEAGARERGMNEAIFYT